MQYIRLADPGLSLRKRRRWFADDETEEQPNTEDTQGDKGNGESSAETENAGITREPMIPRERFDEVNTKYKALAEKLEQFEAEREAERQKADAAQQKQLAEQGKFKELYEGEQQKVTSMETEKKDLSAQLKAAQEKLDAMTAIFQKQLDSRLEQVPEYVKDLLTGREPLDAIAWLDDHSDDLEAHRKGAPRANASDGLRSPKGKTVVLNKPARL